MQGITSRHAVPLNPSLPACLQTAVASAPVQQAWQVHYTAEGRPYYYNQANGATQWEAPPAS